MNNLLCPVAILLLIIWVIGGNMMSAGNAIHFMFFLALAATAVRITRAEVF